MTIKPEDRLKMIGLIAAIGGVACYFLLCIVPRLSGAQTAPPPQETPLPAPAAASAPVAAPIVSAGPGAQTAPPGTTNSVLVSEEPPRPRKRDPFLSPVQPSAPHFLPTAAPLTVTKSPLQPAAGVQADPAAIQPAATGGTAKAKPTVPATLPSMTLLGVADGDAAVAVFQIGQTVLEKKQGEMLPGAVRVLAIDAAGVSLVQGKTKYRLDVGNTAPQASLNLGETRNVPVTPTVAARPLCRVLPKRSPLPHPKKRLRLFRPYRRVLSALHRLYMRAKPLPFRPRQQARAPRWHRPLRRGTAPLWAKKRPATYRRIRSSRRPRLPRQVYFRFRGRPPLQRHL